MQTGPFPAVICSLLDRICAQADVYQPALQAGDTRVAADAAAEADHVLPPADAAAAHSAAVVAEGLTGSARAHVALLPKS